MCCLITAFSHCEGTVIVRGNRRNSETTLLHWHLCVMSHMSHPGAKPRAIVQPSERCLVLAFNYSFFLFLSLSEAFPWDFHISFLIRLMTFLYVLWAFFILHYSGNLTIVDAEYRLWTLSRLVPFVISAMSSILISTLSMSLLSLWETNRKNYEVSSSDSLNVCDNS
jgi:hypothetical protein